MKTTIYLLHIRITSIYVQSVYFTRYRVVFPCGTARTTSSPQGGCLSRSAGTQPKSVNLSTLLHTYYCCSAALHCTAEKKTKSEPVSKCVVCTKGVQSSRGFFSPLHPRFREQATCNTTKVGANFAEEGVKLAAKIKRKCSPVPFRDK